MSDPRRSRTVLAVLVLVALALVTVDFRQGDDGLLAAVRRGAVALFAPVQEGFATVVRPVGTFLTAVGDVGQLRGENAELAERVAELRGAQRESSELARENAELRAELGMRERLQLDTVGAEVIGQPPGQLAYSVLLDAGAEQGLGVGMAVLGRQGLVGRLTQVTADHARVELVSSPDARYAVRILPSGATGLLQGQGTRPFRMELLDPDVAVDAGNRVVTRTFAGSTIPEGIPVGVVGGADTGNPRYRTVRPYVDLSRLSFVQVVTNAPGQPATLPSEELVPAPPRPRPTVSPAPTDADGLAGVLTRARDGHVPTA